MICIGENVNVLQTKIVRVSPLILPARFNCIKLPRQPFDLEITFRNIGAVGLFPRLFKCLLVNLITEQCYVDGAICA